MQKYKINEVADLKLIDLDETVILDISDLKIEDITADPKTNEINISLSKKGETHDGFLL